ncbi:serine hydrolase domain-containing protein [Chryseobacterium zhengzhouense]|uniref:Serine hydrolase domain-containing protein n=2 Tax=Chryseobacterium TaxID=59732 RepID=A0ABW2LVR4_9FLAO
MDNFHIRMDEISLSLNRFSLKILTKFTTHNNAMRLRFIILIFLCLIFKTSAQTHTNLYQKIIDSVYEKNPEMIGVLVHIESPKISWSYAKGFDGKNLKQNLNVRQPLLIASTTKTFMAATILRLAEKGKLNINQNIKNLITETSRMQLTKAGYNLDSITIRHLLSHTSGIRDYVDEGYFTYINENKQHQWTREEQIERAAKLGHPLGKPGTIFHYADINYVLLSKIIEHFTNEPFYTSVRKLLMFKKNHLNNTWFIQLEKQHKNTLPLVNQYWSHFNWNIKDLNPSWDLYGGGGLASNVEDMARFYQLLFTEKIIKNKDILKLMSTNVPPDFTTNYCLGIRKIKVGNIMGYNHGGGLGTDATYFPELNTTISIASVEADKRNVALQMRDVLVKRLKKEM